MSQNNYYDRLWNKTLNCLKENNSIEIYIYNNFYENKTKLISIDDKIAYVETESVIVQQVLNQDKEKILNTLASFEDDVTDISFLLENQYGKQNNNLSEKVDILTQKQIESNINQDYSFENFVVGPSNKESHSAALAIAYSPGKLYNPLFIYGNSGLGKTHLLHAVGNYILKNHPDKNIKYFQCSEFVDNVISTIKTNTIANFKKEMSELDILLLDDIQFLAGGKEKSNEVFFQIYNSLIEKKKQIIITSDRIPTEISGIENRLISRFSSGLSVTISSPSYETSIMIIKQKIKKQSFDNDYIDEDIINYIATNYSRDIRALEGALTRLLFFGVENPQHTKLNLKNSLSAFTLIKKDNDNSDLNINKIKKAVCEYYGINKTQLISQTRTKQIALSRHIAIYLSRKYLDLPFAKIGEEFGKRDHSTALKSFEKIEKEKKKDTILQQAISEIEKLLNY